MQRRIRRERRRCKKAKKIIFYDEVDAMIALARRRDNHQRPKIPLRYYPCCPDCGKSECEHTSKKHFHLTSEKERRFGPPGQGFKDEG